MSNPLAAYYRLGDAVGSYSVKDSSGNGNTGSLIAGTSGTPSFGYAGFMLFDPNTACDLTAGSNVLSGGFSTTDNSTSPPTVHNPLGAASSWTFECWLKWTSSTNTTPGQITTFTGTLSAGPTYFIIQNVSSYANLAVGDAITGTNILPNSVITSIVPGTAIVVTPNPSAGGVAGTFAVSGGAVGSTLFSAASAPNTGGAAIDIRVGAATSASITSFNRVTAGTYIGGIYTVDATSTNMANVLDGGWHHVVLPYSASVISIYIDGSFDSSWNTNGSWIGPSSITIGCDAGPANGWVGAMQDVALYSSVLTAAQIQNHYSIGTWFRSQEVGAASGSVSAGRLNKVLAVAGLNPSQMLNVPYPFKTTLYAETNNVTTTSGLNYLQTLSETEPGLVFAGPNGMVNCYSRQYQYLSPNATTSQATFADNPNTPLHFDGPSLQIVQDDLDTWTSIQVASGRQGAVLQEWGPVQSATMAAAASVYGARTLQGLTSLQFEYDSDALAVSTQYGSWYSMPVRRVTSMTIESYGSGGATIPQLLGRGLYDRLTISYTGQSPGTTFSADSLIESIAHNVNIANGPIWSTTFQTSPYEIILEPTLIGSWTFGTPASQSSLTL